MRNSPACRSRASIAAGTAATLSCRVGSDGVKREGRIDRHCLAGYQAAVLAAHKLVIIKPSCTAKSTLHGSHHACSLQVDFEWAQDYQACQLKSKRVRYFQSVIHLGRATSHTSVGHQAPRKFAWQNVCRSREIPSPRPLRFLHYGWAAHIPLVSAVVWSSGLNPSTAKLWPNPCVKRHAGTSAMQLEIRACSCSANNPSNMAIGAGSLVGGSLLPTAQPARTTFFSPACNRSHFDGRFRL